MWQWILTLHFAVHFKWFQRPTEIRIDGVVSRPILATESVGLAWLFINRCSRGEMINLLLLGRYGPSVTKCKEIVIKLKRLAASTYTCDTPLLYSRCSHTDRWNHPRTGCICLHVHMDLDYICEQMTWEDGFTASCLSVSLCNVPDINVSWIIKHMHVVPLVIFLTCLWCHKCPTTTQHSAPTAVAESSPYQAVHCRWRYAACNHGSGSAWSHTFVLCYWFLDNLSEGKQTCVMDRADL